MNSIIVKTLTVFFLVNFISYPQKADKQIYVSAGPILTNSHGDFYYFWNSDPGIYTELAFDHPIGKLGVGFSYMKFNKKNDLTYSFNGIDYYLLYRNQLNLYSNLNLIVGLDMGIYEFRFDNIENIKSEAELNEREFALKLVSGINYTFSDSWSAEFSISYCHIYTKKEIEMFSLRIGLVKSFNPPELLKEFLE